MDKKLEAAQLSEDQYYVSGTSVLADHDTRVLKGDETFAIFEPSGDIQSLMHGESGLFCKGTRYLSRLEINLIEGMRPLLLSSTLRDDNGVLKVDLTNPDFFTSEKVFCPKGTLHLHREKFIINNSCEERISIVNYGEMDLELNATLRVDADFADIFEVRGMPRTARGTIEEPFRDGNDVVFSYLGLDRIRRQTRIEVRGVAFDFESGFFKIPMRLLKHQSLVFEISITPVENEVRSTSGAGRFTRSLLGVHAQHDEGRQRFAEIKTSNEQFEAWLKRSTDDLVMMTTRTPDGYLYPYAGIPWYCAAFGRDGILTALECLWANPELSRGVLLYLAATQSKMTSALRDATPGKIIHEVRFGEMANLGEVPFGKYYGSIDSTPLFLVLAGCYLTRTGDLDLVNSIWPQIEAALQWIDLYGDKDGDGFVEYERENPQGLIHQGWKDSRDCVFHADGSEARGPIALAEVQGYVHMAFAESAKLAEAVGKRELSLSLRLRAEVIKEKFDQQFWLEDLGTYALALDGEKTPCRVVSSNAGQCLFTGIVKRERQARLAKTLMAPESFSGWGIRTVATTAARYNPMSYHNGSVWPHDTALVSWGLSKIGAKYEVERLFSAQFRCALFMPGSRMPEVICGFERTEGEAPTQYPSACSPQAWAAGSVYLMVQSLLGLQIDARAKRVHLLYPALPESIETLKIMDLSVGDASLDLVFQNYHSDVSVQILNRVGDVSVTVEK